ncbi:ATP-binding protein [Pseudomonas aeruginosa]|uniref:ATP-binding protein n=1 Tax=Pseudomonas aeruginosa TaxID=287 RepID=UPI003A4DA2DC
MEAHPTPVDLSFNALRLCEAIARIGYEPYTAIMDLIDNSVTAKATEILVTLNLRQGKTLKTRNSVTNYQIVDNGKGMDHNEILNAFTLGSTKNYQPNSLSKYGMGLKSAGLSLGSRITIISKKNSSLSDKYTFDTEEIDRLNRLAVIQTTLSSEEKENYNRMLTGESGTVVEISGCENTNQSSPGSTVTKLKERLGVVYYSFLNNTKDPLKIKLRVSPYDGEGAFEDISPKDLLFIDKAKSNTGWQAEDYDFTSPYLVLNASWDSFKDKEDNPLPPILIQAVAFPQASMGDDKSPLTPDQKRQIREYRVSRENSGFFIYRNGRLIRWGDGLERPNGKPLITKDDINIRIRFEIKDQHDDILHVDVSKQRLEIDDEILASLEKIVSQALRTAKDIRQACQGKLKVRHGEGQTFSNSIRDVSEDDPQEQGKGIPSPQTLDRQSQKNEEAKEALEKIEEEEASTQDEDPTESTFKKIRYSEKIPYGQLWKPYFDSTEGVFVCINKNHPFYEIFLSSFEEGTRERLTLEALIFSAGLAETNVYNNETDIEPEKLATAFRRYHKNIDSFLQEWAYENQEDE